MMRRSSAWAYRMKMGRMHLDFKLCSRDHKRSLAVEDAVVDVSRDYCVAPMSWLEALRSPSSGLPTGYYTETPVAIPTGSSTSAQSPPATSSSAQSNAVKAGPVVMYIVGQPAPVVLDMVFVNESDWGKMEDPENMDIRIGRDAIEQCTLFSELRPGGLLSEEPLSVLKDRGLMQVGLAESPYARRPWTRMKTYFIDELQRGPQLNEYIGHNAHEGRNWRFSQYCKHFRVGIWRETTRTRDLVEGLHGHSSYQRSPQQSVPGVRHMAPSP